MKAILIQKDGTITLEEGDEDFWMDDNIVWAETEPPQFPGHTIYYNDEANQDPGEVRINIGGVEVPLPAWLMGIDGEDTCDPTVSEIQVRDSIALPG